MSILTILARNFGLRSRTRRHDDAVPHPAGFRGLVMHVVSLCTGCGTCAAVCSPAAIRLTEQAAVSVTWQYDAAACTFCGRCAEYCPTKALELAAEPPAVTGDRASLRTAHPVFYRPCTRCGQPVVPLPGPVLVRLYGDPLPAEISRTRWLCERCRAKTTGENVRDAWKGKLHEG